AQMPSTEITKPNARLTIRVCRVTLRADLVSPAPTPQAISVVAPTLIAEKQAISNMFGWLVRPTAATAEEEYWPSIIMSTMPNMVDMTSSTKAGQVIS